MAGGFENDPQSQDGLPCPRNFVGITFYAELAELEAFYVPKRAVQLEAAGVIGSFDLAHLRTIHRYLFQDVFPWAGELRQVGLAKAGGFPFASPMHIASALTETFHTLKAEQCLRGTDAATFRERALTISARLTPSIPFDEGNGRTQREFLRQLAVQAGHTISWAAISQAENVAASIASHTKGDNSGLAKMIAKALVAGG